MKLIKYFSIKHLSISAKSSILDVWLGSEFDFV